MHVCATVVRPAQRAGSLIGWFGFRQVGVREGWILWQVQVFSRVQQQEWVEACLSGGAGPAQLLSIFHIVSPDSCAAPHVTGNVILASFNVLSV